MTKKAIMSKMLMVIAVIAMPIAGYCQHAEIQGSAEEGGLVKWMTLSEAMEKVKVQPRPIIMDFYTSWCGWCKQMMRTTYSNPGLAQYINTNFYPVKFDAEGKDTIEYLGVKYPPNVSPEGKAGAHSLAIKLLQGKLMYPTTLFLNGYDKTKNDFQFSMLAAGYLEEKKLEPILVYSLENVFRNCAYEDYHTEFDKAFYDTTIESQLKEVKWLSPKQAFNGNIDTKKKKLVFIHTDWCNACKVMQRTTFIDTSVSGYLKEKYDLVDFNPESTDTLIYNGKTYVNQRSPQMPFHQLSLALSRNNFVLPTLAILDENDNLLDAVTFYIQPSFLKDISHYYGDNIFKTKSWQDYIKGKEDAKKSTN